MIDLTSIPDFYRGYVQQLSHDSILKNLRVSGEELVDMCSGLSEEKGEHAYQDGKWTIKEVLLHIIDSERIFAYRALRFSRNDKTDLPGFEQNDYVPESRANHRSMNSLLTEFLTVRVATTSLYETFDDSFLKRSGTANGFPVSVAALGYIIAGHCVHHTKILKERYLKDGH